MMRKLEAVNIQKITSFLTVSMIMTPRNELCTFKPNDTIFHALNIMRKKNYDIAPIEDNGILNRFIKREELEKAPPSDTCDKVARIISVEHIISENMSIEDLLSLFCKQDFFFVLGRGGIVGMVTYADLNKIAVKTLFYLLISELQENLLKLIRQRFPKTEICLEYLSQEQKEKIMKIYNQAKNANTELPIEYYFMFSHIIEIISKDAELREKCGFTSRSQAEKMLNPLVDLRNTIMHQRPLIMQKNDIEKLKQRYDTLQNLIQQCLRSL